MIAPEWGDPAFKSWWMDFWGHIEGSPDVEAAWVDKVALMEGRRIRDVPMIFVQQDVHYESPIDGRVIRSKHERIDDLRRNNCIEYDPEMKKDANRRKAEAESALDRSIDETVEREIATMPGRKREALANELQSGVDVQTVRLTANGG